jgi:hypothetical protein
VSEPMQSVWMEEVFLVTPPYRLDITFTRTGRGKGREDTSDYFAHAQPLRSGS